jgi:hypothetical protein
MFRFLRERECKHEIRVDAHRSEFAAEMELSGNLGLDKSARGSMGGIYIQKEKRSTFQFLLLRRIRATQGFAVLCHAQSQEQISRNDPPIITPRKFYFSPEDATSSSSRFDDAGTYL